jgi:hypothetical protein
MIGLTVLLVSRAVQEGKQSDFLHFARTLGKSLCKKGRTSDFFAPSKNTWKVTL